MKLKKSFRYIIYKLSDDHKTITVAKAVENGDYDQFVAELPANECRYAVYDFEYQISETEGQRNKICFYVWAPDTAKIKQKMIYASSKDALRKKLVGVATEVQGTDLSEVSYETVLDRITSV